MRLDRNRVVRVCSSTCAPTAQPLPAARAPVPAVGHFLNPRPLPPAARRSAQRRDPGPRGECGRDRGPDGGDAAGRRGTEWVRGEQRGV